MMGNARQRSEKESKSPENVYTHEKSSNEKETYTGNTKNDYELLCFYRPSYTLERHGPSAKKS